MKITSSFLLLSIVFIFGCHSFNRLAFFNVDGQEGTLSLYSFEGLMNDRISLRHYYSFKDDKSTSKSIEQVLLWVNHRAVGKMVAIFGGHDYSCIVIIPDNLLVQFFPGPYLEMFSYANAMMVFRFCGPSNF